MEVWSVRRDNVKFGYNAATGKYKNLMAAGIIDATKGKYEHQYGLSEEFQQELKIKVPEILIEREWRRRKMQMRILEEEGKLKNDDDEEAKEMWKRKREYEAECVCVYLPFVNYNQVYSAIDFVEIHLCSFSKLSHEMTWCLCNSNLLSMYLHILSYICIFDQFCSISLRWFSCCRKEIELFFSFRKLILRR